MSEIASYDGEQRTTRSIVLLGSDKALVSAIVRGFSREKFTLIEVNGEISEASPSTEIDFALAVVKVPTCTIAVELVRPILKMFRDVPVVVVSESEDRANDDSLRRLGAVVIYQKNSSLDDLAKECLSHASPDTSILMSEIIGSSAEIREVRRTILKCANSPARVLITGETGTGKSLVARTLHRLSPHPSRPFVPVDCASLSPTLIESELFGHERGAFTGALGRRKGRFELVENGTVFLDEIGELESSLQKKFLRVLEDREFERVGGTESIRLRARVLAATSRNLEQDVESGHFRSDLYYRLRVIQLRLPALRDRLGDIPALVKIGLERAASDLGRVPPSFGSTFCDRLMMYGWPGNVRELVHLLEATLVRCPAEHLEAEQLDGILPDRATTAKLAQPTVYSARGDNAYERAQLLRLIIETGGNVSRVARRMKLARSTARYKIRRYGLSEHIPPD